MAADLDQLVDQATRALDRERPDEALRLLDRVIAEAPDHVDAIVLKAEALVLKDEWEAAEELLQEAAHTFRDNPTVLLASADLVLDMHPDDGAAVEQAYEMAQRGEAAAEARGEDDLLAELQLTQGHALSILGELIGSMEAFQRAYESSGHSDDVRVELAMAQFEAVRFDEARASLEQLRKSRPDDARVHHYLGLLAERAGRDADAAASFARAHELDPEEFPEPVTMSDEEFSQVVEDAFERLPERVRGYLKDVPVMIDPIPADDDIVQDPPLSPLSLGMFRGRSLQDVSVMDPWSQLPSSILLFKRNLERYARSREELIEEIETTLLHEVGHFVGWDEEDLRERGLD